MPAFYTGIDRICNEGFIIAQPPLDPTRWFSISIDMFGDGLSNLAEQHLRRPATARRFARRHPP